MSRTIHTGQEQKLPSSCDHCQACINIHQPSLSSAEEGAATELLSPELGILINFKKKRQWNYVLIREQKTGNINRSSAKSKRERF